ncbi:N-acetylneuraminate synthase [Sporosarcina beigongshangi]|uniref:N-acetylneuraminate synthase n=1 Tax=Sporosarcina beigongshangi TaxID=2782538 RepID=UPI001939339F|nr:N-acetylneuraminate synthase [Sporosarcina beigongshangi]
MSNQTYIIAEAGVNHNGSLDMAKKLVDVAKQAGADAVKFQTFKAENLVTRAAQQAGYQVSNLGETTSQFEMLKKLELSYEEFAELKNYCDSTQIEFLSTPFDFESVDFLLDDIGMNTLKIPSGELTNSPFIHYIATKRKPMIISTGMATMDDIHEALSFLAYGLAFPDQLVELEKVEIHYQTLEAKTLLKEFVTVLHCTTEYPAPFETINLRAMNEMEKELRLPIGFSDHSEGIAVPIAAVALGAVIIEKHFTLDCNLPGPDHRASLEPKELEEMVVGIRVIEQSLGSGNKQPTSIELENRLAARKSIVAKVQIAPGDILTEAHLAIKRPGNGMPPTAYWSLIGKTVKQSYEVDALIDE